MNCKGDIMVKRKRSKTKCEMWNSSELWVNHVDRFSLLQLRRRRTKRIELFSTLFHRACQVPIGIDSQSNVIAGYLSISVENINDGYARSLKCREECFGSRFWLGIEMHRMSDLNHFSLARFAQSMQAAFLRRCFPFRREKQRSG